VHEAALPALYRELAAHGFTEKGANAFADITSCPGTDTCNLAISNSTGVSAALENLIATEFPRLADSKDISIKISGCMNSCGQHAIASIGFHGSSMKAGHDVVPALQLLLGGGISGNGEGRIAEKILKFPSKRATAVLRILLSDFIHQKLPGELFTAFYERKGKDYFYQLLKAFSSVSEITPDEFIDWGQDARYTTEIGIGECAGVKIDLVATLLLEAKDALLTAEENFAAGRYSDAVYKAYNAFIHAAKALLLKRDVQVNTQHGIISDFDRHFSLQLPVPVSFRELVSQVSENAPTKTFAKTYISQARQFLEFVPSLEKQTILSPDPNLN
jgi:sulfite reductase (ferredoxin)